MPDLRQRIVKSKVVADKARSDKSRSILDAAPSHDYRPILSFGKQSRWLHGV